MNQKNKNKKQKIWNNAYFPSWTHLAFSLS